MSIKVLVISNYRETNSVRPEAELFIGLKKEGVEVEIMTFGNAVYAEKFREAGIRVIDFHPQKKFERTEVQRIRAELTAGRHDILHLFNSQAIINGIRAAKGLPVKVVLYRGYTGNVHWYDPSAYFKYLHPRVDCVMCAATATAEQLQRQLFFNKNKAVIICKGHDLAWYEGIEPLGQEEWPDIPAKAFRVVCVANNRPVKGIRYLLEATWYLPMEFPVHLILVGKNMDAGPCRSLLDGSPNRDKIHLTGYRTDVLNIVAASNVLVLASVKAEANTKAVIEAMSLGVTPVITAIPGNRELVVHEKNGLVVPPKNPAAIAAAILQLYHDRERCSAFGQAATAHIETNFNLRDTVSRAKKLYEELVEKNSVV
ncbi:MAG: glycosyltransferase family 4 protein [Bacteroidetes bacterium]|nr:glycosyltransferase family 4 protein [Bacteroidota bacterium]